MRGRLEIGGSLLRRAMADVLGAVWGGTVHTLYGYLDWLAKQLFGDTAERAELLRKAALYEITPVPATFATGTATATGTNGTPILADTIIKLDAATRYRVTTGQVIAGGTATLPITAVLAGSDANIPLGTSLTFENPIAGVNPTATVAADITNGVDEEGTEDLRTRYLARLREPPEGGADQDYIAWARQVAGVTRVWVYRNELGRGTVVVRFVRDNDPSIFPDVGEVAAVQAKLAAERPTTAEATALAPTALVVAFTVHIVPDNADTRVAVTAELTDLLARRAEPGDGVARGKVLLSEIRTAIGTAAGVTDYTTAVPAADVVPGLGQLATVGVITWT
jgi:uncharacterized phage protein gp47/JayE